MIRIVETRPDPSVVKRRVCSHCGVTLEYVPADVREEQHYDYTGGSDLFRFIPCPACNHKNSVR